MKATVVQDKKPVSEMPTVAPVQVKPLAFDVPREFAKLPSKGKLYGSDSNLHDLEDIEIRVMTAKEEDILTSRSLSRKGLTISRLLQSVVVDKSINIGDLICGDRDALLIAVRITGYGPEYKVTIECPVCEEQVEHTFDLSQLPINELGVKPVAEYNNLFETVLPRTGATVLWKFITGDEELKITQMQKKRKNTLNVDIDNLVTTKLLYSIVSVDGVEDRGQIANFVRNMPAQDSMALRDIMNDNQPQVRMEGAVICGECGEETQVDIPMTVQFFWPSARR